MGALARLSLGGIIRRRCTASKRFPTVRNGGWQEETTFLVLWLVRHVVVMLQMLEVLVALDMDSPRWDWGGPPKETQPCYLTRVRPCMEPDSHPRQSVGYPHLI